MEDALKNNPLVSVCLMTYDRAPYLRGVIDSWLSQTYSNFELVISDDASSDETPKICEEYVQRDKRVRYFRNEKNLNAPGCFKAAFGRARGKYFIWASDDDLWDKRFLEDCLGVFEKDPELIMVFADMVDVDRSGNVLKHLDPAKYMPLARDLYARLKEFILFYLTEDGKVQLIYGLWKKEAVLNEPMFGYREKDDRFPFYMGFDSFFTLRNLPKGPVGFVKETRFFHHRAREEGRFVRNRSLVVRIPISFYHRLEKIFGSPYFWYVLRFTAGVKELSLFQRLKLILWNFYVMARVFFVRKA
jgi:glycosyltransferase involved in cell wall biosynthesis